MRAGRTRSDLQRRLLRDLSVFRAHRTVLDHAIDHVVAAFDGAVALPIGIKIAGSLGQRREIGRFRHGQLMHGLVEIDQRRRGDTVGAEAEIDLVEIEFENLVLGIGALDFQRQQRLLGLALEGDFVGQQEVLGDLLGDGGGALRAAVAAVILEIDHRRAGDSRKIQTAMLVKILIFRCEEGVDDQLRHRLDRDIESALSRVFRDQRTVRRMHTGHDGRFIVPQLRIVGQVLGKMPHQACGRGHADQKQNGPRREQKPEETECQPHRPKSVGGVSKRQLVASSKAPCGRAVLC